MLKTIRGYVSLTMFLLFVAAENCTYGKEEEPLDSRNILALYQNSLVKFREISMKVHCEYLIEGNSTTWKTDIIHRRSNNRTEWIGKNTAFDSNGSIEQEGSTLYADIMNGSNWVHLKFYNPQLIGGQPPRAYIKKDFEQAQKELLDVPSYGGPIQGRIHGNNHKSVAELLSESVDLRLIDNREDINGESCYLLTATIMYGKVTAWIAPEKGYNALRWKIEKKSGEFFRGPEPARDEFKMWVAVFEADEVKKIDDEYMITKGRFTQSTTLKDGKKEIVRYIYNLTDVDLNPDFEDIGAFQINLPEGTSVYQYDAPGIVYIWKQGRLVHQIDDSVVGNIDNIRQENDSVAGVNRDKNLDLTNTKNPEIPANQSKYSNGESKAEKPISNIWLAVIIISLLIIAIGSILYLRRLKTQRGR